MPARYRMFADVDIGPDTEPAVREIARIVARDLERDRCRGVAQTQPTWAQILLAAMGVRVRPITQESP
jgi:hypothetical protein